MTTEPYIFGFLIILKVVTFLDIIIIEETNVIELFIILTIDLHIIGHFKLHYSSNTFKSIDLFILDSFSFYTFIK